MEETYQEIQNTMQKTLRAFSEIMDLINKLTKKKPSEIIENVNGMTGEKSPFIFTGQVTDLSYFQSTKSMPLSAIAGIEDQKLQAAVKSTFEDAAKQKLVNVDNSKGIITLTEKGKKYISKPSFVKAACKDQLNAMTNKLETLKSTTTQAVSQTAAKTASKTAAKAGGAAVQAAIQVAKVLKKD